MATGSLICGILAFCFWPLAIVAIILGFLAKNEIRRTGQAGDGMATAGIVLGFIFVALGILFLMFFMTFGFL